MSRSRFWGVHFLLLLDTKKFEEQINKLQKGHSVPIVRPNLAPGSKSSDTHRRYSKMAH